MLTKLITLLTYQNIDQLDFWVILKGKAYENNRVAKDFQTLKVKIKKCLKEIESNTIIIDFVRSRRYKVIENR
jgi:hypothetical protein